MQRNTYLVDEEDDAKQHLSSILSLFVGVLSDVQNLKIGIEEGLYY